MFAGKCGAVEAVVQLDEPKLILLDSKRMLHAAQRSEEEARAGFAASDHRLRC